MSDPIKVGSRLTDLGAKWIKPAYWASDEPYFIGARFPCPHCGKPLSVMFWPHIDPLNLRAKWGWTFTREQIANGECIFDRTGDTLETLTITPSISIAGHWHGHITNGEIRE